MFKIQKNIGTTYSGVMKFAYENYDNGWDVLIECHSMAEVIDAIEDAKTINQAIKNVDKNLAIGAYNEKKREIVAEIF